MPAASTANSPIRARGTEPRAMNGASTAGSPIPWANTGPWGPGR